MAKSKGTVWWIALILLVVGGLNWGLVGLVNYNVVEAILGSIPILLKIVYILVGLSALYAAFKFR